MLFLVGKGDQGGVDSFFFYFLGEVGADCSGRYCVWEECSVTISSSEEEEQRGDEERDERIAIDGLGKDGEIEERRWLQEQRGG